jgi:hypothetical protein
MKVKIITAIDSSWGATIARLSDGTEIPSIRRIDFHHQCDEVAVAAIEVICDEIEVDASGELTTMFMNKKYRLVECLD